VEGNVIVIKRYLRSELRRMDGVQIVLFLALFLALVGSMKHVAWAFATLESGDMIAGYIQAVAIDVGLFGLAFGIQQRKRERRSTRMLWGGVVLFSAVSTYANLLHGLAFAQPVSLSLGGGRMCL